MPSYSKRGTAALPPSPGARRPNTSEKWTGRQNGLRGAHNQQVAVSVATRRMARHRFDHHLRMGIEGRAIVWQGPTGVGLAITCKTVRSQFGGSHRRVQD